jgi:hypothetical protein
LLVGEAEAEERSRGPIDAEGRDLVDGRTSRIVAAVQQESAPLQTRPELPPADRHRLWKRSWSLRILARLNRQDAARLIVESETLIARIRRERLRLV